MSPKYAPPYFVREDTKRIEELEARLAAAERVRLWATELLATIDEREEGRCATPEEDIRNVKREALACGRLREALAAHDAAMEGKG